MFNTDRGLRRKRDFTHAIRKMMKCRKFPWYNNLHQYSKNKIHCSCSLCQSRTGETNSIKSHKARDRKKLEKMNHMLSEEMAECAAH